MKRKIGLVLGLVSVLTVGIGIGYGLNTTEPIHILEKAHVLGNGSVLNSKESLTEEGDRFDEDSSVLQNNLETSELTQETNSSTIQDNNNVEKQEPIVTHEQPTIRLNGDSVLSMESVDQYTELGAQAFDEDGNALEVSISGSVNRDCACEHVLTYTATDQWGQRVSTTRTVHVSHPNFTSFESFTQDTQHLALGQTVTFTLSDTVSSEDAPISRLDRVWISLQGNTGDFIEIPMVSKDEHSVILQYTYSQALPSTTYRFNGIYKSIERINAVEVNVTWDISLRIE